MTYTYNDDAIALVDVNGNQLAVSQSQLVTVVSQSGLINFGVSGSQVFPVKVDSSGSLHVSGVVLSLPFGTQTITGTIHVDNNNLPISVSNFPAIQTITGSVTINNPGSNSTVNQGTSGSLPWKFLINDGITTFGNVSANPLWVTGSVTQNNFPVTQSVKIVDIGTNITQSITGSVTINNPATSISINNLPTTQSVKIDQTIILPVSVSNFPAIQTITGSVSTTNPSVGGTGSLSPLSGTLIGGSDGINLRSIKVASDGTVFITGSITTNVANNSIAGNSQNIPISSTLIGGSDGTLIRPIKVLSDGTQIITGSINVNNLTFVSGNNLSVFITSSNTLPVTGTITVNQPILVNQGNSGSIPWKVKNYQENIVIHSGSTITSNGSQIITGLSDKEINLEINIKANPTGTTPRIYYTIQEVDDSDLTTVDEYTYSSDPLGAIGIRSIQTFIKGSAVKISWTITGTTPSFTQVFALLTTKPNASVHARSQWDYTPSNYASLLAPFVDETVPLTVDGGGQLVVRGDILTDEGSFRTDFGGNSLDWTITGTCTFVNGSKTVTGVGTFFADEIGGEYIRHGSDNSTFGIKVARVVSQTELLLEEVYGGTTGASATCKAAQWKDISPARGGSISYSTSIATLNPGTGNGNSAVLYKAGDYLPISCYIKAATSIRNNQTTQYYGLVDDPVATPVNWEYGAWIIIDGTVNTTIKFRTQFSSNTGDAEEATYTLPAGLTTASSLLYNIDVSSTSITLTIEGILVAQHKNHLVDPYFPMDIVLYAASGGNQAGTLAIDNVYWNNTNIVQLGNEIKGAPINIVNSEEVQYISAQLTTTATTADQLIISYTVPAGRLLLISGWRVNNNSTTVNGNPVKIGKNTLTEAAAPGTSNNNIFQALYLPAGQNQSEVYSIQPRKFAYGGDIVKISVTPSAATSTIWRATLEYILR